MVWIDRGADKGGQTQVAGPARETYRECMTQLISFSFGVVLTLMASSSHAAQLKITIENIRSAQGQVLIAVYKDADAFPKKPEAALIKKAVPAKEGQLSLEIHDLEPGAYAVALHHDEDGNNQMGFNFVGIPKEGFGFSGNKRIYFGPPSFKNAKFDLAPTNSNVEIKMKYF